MTTVLLKQRGAVLVIALVLLLIVTLLATTGMAISTSELAMAGNEQFHRQARDAASAGIETALARFAAVPRDLRDSVVSAGMTVSGKYAASVRFKGREANLPGFSSEKFTSLHFEIESNGRAARNATDQQLQGVMIIESQDATVTFTRAGEGVAGEGGDP
jgi:type II secretory pathway component PulK